MAGEIPLEDELGDVLDKALRRAGCSDEEIARRAGVPVGKLRDAIDYRYDLAGAEVRRLAAALHLACWALLGALVMSLIGTLGEWVIRSAFWH